MFILFFLWQCSLAMLTQITKAQLVKEGRRNYGESMLVSVMTQIATLFPESSRCSTCCLVKNPEYPSEEGAQDTHRNLWLFDRYLRQTLRLMKLSLFLAQTSYGPAGSPVRSADVVSPSLEYPTPPPSASDVERKIKDLVSWIHSFWLHRIWLVLDLRWFTETLPESIICVFSVHRPLIWESAKMHLLRWVKHKGLSLKVPERAIMKKKKPKVHSS